MIKAIVSVCAGAIILSLSGRVLYLEKRVKKLEDTIFQFARKAEYNSQSENDRFHMVSSNLIAMIDRLYAIKIFNDDDIAQMVNRTDSELLERHKNDYGVTEGQKRYDIYVNSLDEPIDLTFFKKMN